MRDERSSSTEETIGKTTILNVAAGRFMPLDLEKFRPCLINNVDLMYSHGVESMADVEVNYLSWTPVEGKSNVVYCKIDIWEFLENFSQRFDHIVVYLILEHVPMAKLDYFIYLLSADLKVGS